MTKITVCQYQIDNLSNWDSYATKVEALVSSAKKSGSNLLLLPEYAGTEAVCGKFATENELFVALQLRLPEYIEFYKQLAQQYQIYIQAGTLIEKTSSGKYVNRAYFFSPDNKYDYQDKLNFTEFEKSLGILQHGHKQKIFETSLGKIGIAICYDSEFPEVVRQLVMNGASIILVPSYTSTLAGYNRVFLSCRARAIENQCYVAVSFVVNKVELSSGTDNVVGQAAILSPADTGFPDDGIIAQGNMNDVMLVSGEINLEKMDSVRKHGQVRNFEDSKQLVLTKEIEMIKL